MGKLLKPGRVVVVLGGRHAGKKGMVLSSHDQGKDKRRYGHCLVLGISAPAKRITRKMGKSTIEKRTRVKPFFKYYNYNHVIPTRYSIPSSVMDPKDLTAIVKDALETKGGDNRESKKALKKTLEAQLTEGLLEPVDGKGKPSRDAIFLRKKLRF